MIKIYRIYDYGTYLLIANTKASKEHHSHFTIKGKNKQAVMDTCHMLIKLIEKEKIPKSTFLLKSALRLSDNKAYKNKLYIELERRLSDEKI